MRNAHGRSDALVVILFELGSQYQDPARGAPDFFDDFSVVSSVGVLKSLALFVVMT